MTISIIVSIVSIIIIVMIMIIIITIMELGRVQGVHRGVGPGLQRAVRGNRAGSQGIARGFRFPNYNDRVTSGGIV